MSTKQKISPKVRKGKRFPFQTSVVCWVDLLGYGKMIASGKFNPLHPNSVEARKRLKLFHKIVAAESAKQFPTLVLNDGAIAYRDLSYRSASVTFDFLKRSWKLFNEIQFIEKKKSYPGARMVIATGFRIRGRSAGIDSTAKQFRSLIKRLKDGKINSIQAIHEARGIRPFFDIIPELQTNFAFTKAYVAERSGEKSGLGGDKCFVDLAIFDQNPLDWLELGPIVHWTCKKLDLESDFAPLLKIKSNHGSKPIPVGIRDGLQIAEYLTDDEEVIIAIRKAKKLISK